MCPMADDFIARIENAKSRFKDYLKRYWWGIFVILFLDFIWELMKHRILGAANIFIDNHVSLNWLKPAVLALQHSAFFHPIILAIELFVVGVFLLLILAYWETRPVKRLGAPIQVKMRELYRTPKDNYNESQFDLFLKVRLELPSLGKTRITGSRFDLLLHGVTEAMEAIADLAEWEIGEWESKPGGATIRSYPLTPLPEQLSGTEPVDGWLHFATKPTTGEMLEKCSIRLIVRTDHGSGYHEREADPLIWNPRKIVISRRVGGQLWNP
jgi:hypothetical protein